jgi:hypothetical protein
MGTISSVRQGHPFEGSPRLTEMKGQCSPTGGCRGLVAAPDPGVLRLIGEESECKGTGSLSSRRIDQIIKASRARRSSGR